MIIWNDTFPSKQPRGLLIQAWHYPCTMDHLIILSYSHKKKHTISPEDGWSWIYPHIISWFSFNYHRVVELTMVVKKHTISPKNASWFSWIQHDTAGPRHHVGCRHPNFVRHVDGFLRGGPPGEVPAKVLHRPRASSRDGVLGDHGTQKKTTCKKADVYT